MNAARARGPIVVDTNVFSADMVPGSPLRTRYARLLTGRQIFISFETATELRYGALRRSWGPARTLRLEALIGAAVVVHTGDDLVHICANLRADCEAVGHALAQKPHSADRWIAATAIRLNVPLVSDDQIFRDVPGLVLETLPVSP